MGGRGAKGIKPGGGGGGGPGGGGGGGGGVVGGRGRVPGGGGGVGGAGGNVGPGQGLPGSGGAPPPAQGRFERPEGPLTQKYRKQLEDKFRSGSDEAKRVYDEYVPRGGAVSDGTRTGTAHYRPYYNDVEMSFRKDSTGQDKEAGSTWFHEHGHYVDFNASLPSRSMDFYNAIERDIRAFEDRWLSDHGMTRSDISEKDLRFRIGREMIQYGSRLTFGIQDIYGGVFREYNAHSGGGTQWGHTWDYWTRGNHWGEVTSEAWANMFDAAFSPRLRQAMQEYLPTAWDWFERRLGGLKK